MICEMENLEDPLTNDAALAAYLVVIQGVLVTAREYTEDMESFPPRSTQSSISINPCSSFPLTPQLALPPDEYTFVIRDGRS